MKAGRKRQKIGEGWKEKTENKSRPEVHGRSPHYRLSTQPSPPSCRELQIVMIIGIQAIQKCILVVVMKTIHMMVDVFPIGMVLVG